MIAPRNPNDRVTVVPEVLLTIARLSTLRVEGVARMSMIPGGVDRLWRRTPTAEGVQILVDGHTVTVDLFIVTRADANMYEVSHAVQNEVARALRQRREARIFGQGQPASIRRHVHLCSGLRAPETTLSAIAQ